MSTPGATVVMAPPPVIPAGARPRVINQYVHALSKNTKANARMTNQKAITEKVTRRQNTKDWKQQHKAARK
jgi:hypothetical protein